MPKKAAAHHGLKNPALYAVVVPTPVAVPKRKNVVEIRRERSLELETKGVIDRVEAVFTALEKRVARFAREEAIAKRRKQLAQARIDRLEEQALKRMQAARIKVAPGWHVTFEEKLCPVSVIIDNEKLIPKQYLRVIPETTAPDKAVIKRAIETGTEVKGAHLAQNVKLERK